MNPAINSTAQSGTSNVITKAVKIPAISPKILARGKSAIGLKKITNAITIRKIPTFSPNNHQGCYYEYSCNNGNDNNNKKEGICDDNHNPYRSKGH